MPYAITQNCCTDASCVAACPVNCIHPTPGEPDFGTTDMLYVDPRTCIDCGACADACPVDAVRPVDLLLGVPGDYPALNAAFYADRPVGRPASPDPVFHAWGPPTFPRALPPGFPVLDVAVVGTGPAGMYAVQELLLHTTARITLFDRLSLPGGLVRFGVAPDHPATKKIGETFARLRGHERVRLRLGVEIGRDVTVAELAARHDAVILAVGASRGRELGVPGEELPGVLSATTVVGWYNGHPEIDAGAVDLATPRVVVVGTGNVALDVARILTAEPADLAGSAIPRPVLERLRSSAVREVVVMGRRGPDAAAWTRSELLALVARAGVELVVDDADPATGAAIDAGSGPAALLRGVRRERIDWSAPPRATGPCRLVLRFGTAPTAFVGDGRVQVVRAAGPVDIRAGLVVRAIGHRAVPVPGVAFDEAAGVVPNERGRVDGPPGVYVVGWIKRGSSGGIGANRTCAAETVGTLVDDVVAGRVAPRRASRLPAAR